MWREKKRSFKLAEVPQLLLVTFAVAFSWFLFAGEFNIQEGIAAALAGIAAATGGYALRVQTAHRQSGHGRWIRYLPGMIFKALADCWTLTAVLYRIIAGRPSRSTFRRIPFEHGTDDPDDTGRRILVTIGTTLQPNSYVAGFNREKNEVLVHQLNPTSDIPFDENLRRKE